MRLAGVFAAAAMVVCLAANGRGQELFAEQDRFYLAPIVGASWAQVLDSDFQPVVASNLFTAGGAGGMAFARDNGQLRLEFEGRYRDSFDVRAVQGPLTLDLGIVDNWSTMVNAWRDFSITDRLGVYGGGGIGAGGYGFNYSLTVPTPNDGIFGANRVTEFAWQVGGGVVYALHERITLDLGYRFYSVGLGSTTLNVVSGGTVIGTDLAQSSFAANELLFSLRIYEPFRRWR